MRLEFAAANSLESSMIDFVVIAPFCANGPEIQIHAKTTVMMSAAVIIINNCRFFIITFFWQVRILVLNSHVRPGIASTCTC